MPYGLERKRPQWWVALEQLSLLWSPSMQFQSSSTPLLLNSHWIFLASCCRSCFRSIIWIQWKCDWNPKKNLSTLVPSSRMDWHLRHWILPQSPKWGEALIEPMNFWKRSQRRSYSIPAPGFFSSSLFSLKAHTGRRFKEFFMPILAIPFLSFLVRITILFNEDTIQQLFLPRSKMFTGMEGGSVFTSATYIKQRTGSFKLF